MTDGGLPFVNFVFVFLPEDYGCFEKEKRPTFWSKGLEEIKMNPKTCTRKSCVNHVLKLDAKIVTLDQEIRILCCSSQSFDVLRIMNMPYRMIDNELIDPEDVDRLASCLNE